MRPGRVRPAPLVRGVVVACAVAFAPVPPASALSSDRDQPIEIEADGMELDNVKNRAVYHGNVVLVQGSIRMKGDRMTLFLRADRSIEKAYLTGRPATFRQTPDGGQGDWRARARRMEYYAARDRLFLLNEAVAWRGEDRFSGERIEYDTRRHRIRAGGEGRKRDRVRMTIQPGQ